MPLGVTVVWNEAALLALHDNPAVLAEVLAMAQPVVEQARADAPKRTGLGAASIHAEVVLHGAQAEIDVGWARDRFYLKFSELGTRKMPARPFLVPALDRYL